MLRISLILALLAGLLALAVSQLVVKKKIDEITSQRNDFEKQKTDAETAKGKAQSDAKKAQENEKKVVKERDEIKTKFDAASADATTQHKRADELEKNLVKTTEQRNGAQEELAAWKALGIPVDQIKLQKAELIKTREERDAYAGEKVILLRNINQLEAKLGRYEGHGTKVVLPPGLKGKVVAVDPKYDFVVLNFGSEQGALEYGEMLVNRAGKLVAKVQIMTVQPNRCIANILPEWKQAEVMEGDQVLH